jgi:hypothetical protein
MKKEKTFHATVPLKVPEVKIFDRSEFHENRKSHTPPARHRFDVCGLDMFSWIACLVMLALSKS